MSDAIGEVLAAHARGEPGAFDTLVTLLYPDLRRLARSLLARGPRRALNTTGLVHDAYERLARQRQLRVQKNAR